MVIYAQIFIIPSSYHIFLNHFQCLFRITFDKNFTGKSILFLHFHAKSNAQRTHPTKCICNTYVEILIIICHFRLPTKWCIYVYLFSLYVLCLMEFHILKWNLHKRSSQNSHIGHVPHSWIFQILLLLQYYINIIILWYAFVYKFRASEPNRNARCGFRWNAFAKQNFSHNSLCHGILWGFHVDGIRMIEIIFICIFIY